ncbi:MAG: hypothetical protein WAT21_14510 [Saprospiraceae bacterium]
MAMITLFIIKRKGVKPTSKKVSSLKDITAIVNIPINLEIRGLIRESPIPVKLCSDSLNQQADKVAYLISKVIDRQALKKQNQLGVEYVRMNSKIMQKAIRDYDIYLNWMVENGILDCDPKYVPGEHSRGYKLGIKYQLKGIKNHVITYPVLVKRLKNGNIDTHSKQRYPKLLQDLQSLTIENYKGLIEETNIGKYRKLAFISSKADIDEEIGRRGKKSLFFGMYEKKLKNAIHQRAINKISIWQNALSKIHEKQFYFNQDKTSFRLHTSAVSVKKELRKHLRVNGERLIACDIKNSQPYFSVGLFLNPKKFKNLVLGQIIHYQGTELDWVYKGVTNMLVKFQSRDLLDSTLKYIDLVSTGKFYEFMADELHNLTNKPWTREAAKWEVFKVFFNPPRYKNLEGRKVLKKHFPEVLRFFTLINYGFKMTKGQTKNLSNYKGNSFARILQRMESQTVLDLICVDLKERYPNIPLITLHDGIATTVGNQYLVKESMESILEQEVGIKGIVEIEWKKWGIGKYPH